WHVHGATWWSNTPAGLRNRGGADGCGGGPSDDCLLARDHAIGPCGGLMDGERPMPARRGGSPSCDRGTLRGAPVPAPQVRITRGLPWTLRACARVASGAMGVPATVQGTLPPQLLLNTSRTLGLIFLVLGVVGDTLLCVEHQA